MISITHLNKQFGKLQVLDQLSLNCEQGQVIAIIGPNGSGKTTLLKSLLGMVLPDSGQITFRNQPIKKDWAYREQVGYMPQTGKYPEHMTLGQVIEMMIDIRKSTSLHLDQDLLEAFGLRAQFFKRIRTLSGGTRQKLSAVLAFLFDPLVLILDEPTAGLDPVSSEQLKEKIQREKSKGKLILITSHILSELEELITEVVYLQEGKLLFHQSWKSLQEQTGEKKLSKAIASLMKTRSTI
jgi:Cu-processing system ATP-binding protein